MAEDPLDSYELIYLMGLSFQQLLQEFVRRLDAAGYADLRPVHGFAFQVLAGPGATSSELAEQLGMTKQAAGQMVDYLQARGYVERRAHPLGGRRRLVVLSARGRRHLADAGPILRAVEAELADRLPGGRLPELRADLRTLIRSATGGGALPPLRPIW